MSVLVAGLLLFLGVHSVSIINASWRDRMAARLGEPVWQGLYGLVALAGFALIVWGYGLARAAPIVLYTPPVALRHAVLLLMVVVFPLLLAAYRLVPGVHAARLEHEGQGRLMIGPLGRAQVADMARGPLRNFSRSSTRERSGNAASARVNRPRRRMSART